jgi:hypothetical protein
MRMNLKTNKIQKGGNVKMNKNKLVSKMKWHGDRNEDLAEAIGISQSRFSAKLNSVDGAEFTMGEIRIIKDRYHLTAEELDEIFFCD